MYKQLTYFSQKTKPAIYVALIISLFFGCASFPPDDEGKSGPKHITKLSISQNPEALMVYIKANQSITCTADRLDVPMGILLSFPETSLKLDRPIYTLADNESISSIKTKEIVEGQTTSALIFIALKKDTPYQLTADASGVRVTFSKKRPPVEAEPPKTWAKKISPTTELTPQAPPAAKHLKRVTATPLKNNIAVNVIADGIIKNYNDFTLDDPARIVFDLHGLKSPYKGQQVIDVGSKWIKRIRHFGHPNRVRLVLETEDIYQKNYLALPKGSGLLIHVGKLPADAAKSPIIKSDDSLANRKATLSWDRIPGATSYNIYWRASPGVTRQNGNKIENIKNPPYTLKGLKPEATYYFVVTTVKEQMESPESQELSFTVE